MENIEKKVGDIEHKVEAGFDAVMRKIDGLDKKYADKRVEKLVYSCVAMILVAFMAALIYFVIPQRDRAQDSDFVTKNI